MYEYFDGTIVTVTPGFIVIDVAGVGYRLLVANPYAYQTNQPTKVYVQQIIRENDQTLYGFATAADKITFNQLLTVTGIGPKSALAILANASTDGLAQAVAKDDVTFLTKFPGVGKKTAQQIILDLKGKLQTAPTAPGVAVEPAAETPVVVNPALADALAALVALGYPDKAVGKLTKPLEQSDETDTDGYLRLGLRLLNGR